MKFLVSFPIVLVLFASMLFRVAPAMGQGWDEWLEWEDDAAERLERVERSRWYVGLGLGRMEISPEVFGLYRVSNDRDLGNKWLAGYQLRSDWDVNVFWWNAGTASVERDGVASRVSYRERGFDFYYRGRVPESVLEWGEFSGWKLGWYGQFGVSYQDADWSGEFASEEEVQPVLGFGLEFETESSWRVRLGFEQYGKDVSALSVRWLMGRNAWQKWLHGRK